MKDITAIYAGSFDPPTNGHLWMIREGAKMFKNLIVSIGTNPNKHCVFTVNERVEMLYKSISSELHNVSINSFNNLYLVDFAKSVDAHVIIRGVRSQEDYGKERDMRNINFKINPNISTVFFFPPPDLAEVSSSMVKGLIGPKGWEKVVSQFVSDPVLEKLKALHYANTQ